MVPGVIGPSLGNARLTNALFPPHRHLSPKDVMTEHRITCLSPSLGHRMMQVAWERKKFKEPLGKPNFATEYMST